MDHTPHSRSRNMVQDYRRNHNILDHSTALKRSLRREQDPRQRHREPTSHHHASELRLGWARQPRQQLSWRRMPTLSVCCSCRTSFHCTCAQRKCFGALIGRAVHGDVYSVAKSEDRPERVNLWPGQCRFTVCQLFDDLVGTGEQRRRYGDAERPGGLDIDHHLEFGRRLYRQVGWLLAL